MSNVYEKLTPPVSDQQISQQIDRISSSLTTLLPDLQLNDPVLLSVFIGPLAEVLAQKEAYLDTVERYGRLRGVPLDTVEDPEIRQELREQIARDLSIDEVAGGFAVGEVTLTLSSPNSILLPSGTQFLVGGLVYRTARAFILRDADSPTFSVSEVPIRSSRDGTFFAVVDLVAEASGARYNIQQGSVMTLAVAIPGVVRVVASSSFVGGRDPNSTQDLIDAVWNNTASRTLGTRDQVGAFLQSNPAVGNVRQYGVIGFGDVEMQRDKRSFIPVGGQMADVYVAAENLPTSHRAILEGVVESPGPSQQTIIRVPIGRDVSPGFLRIDNVVSIEGQKDLPVVEVIYGVDTSPVPGELIPAISDFRHARFSAYQTATLRVRYPEPPDGILVGDTVAVEVTFLRQPAIAASQQLVNSRRYRYVSGDTLIRSAIPILTRVLVNLRTTFDTNVPDPVAIQAAIRNEIMRRPMRPAIFRSDITTAISHLLPDDISIAGVSYQGQLLLPNGTELRLTAQDDFYCPYRPDDQVTARTAAFYLATDWVLLSVDNFATLHTP